MAVLISQNPVQILVYISWPAEHGFRASEDILTVRFRRVMMLPFPPA